MSNLNLSNSGEVEIHPGRLTAGTWLKKTHTPLEKENHLNQTIIDSGSMLIFGGRTKFLVDPEKRQS